MVVIGSKSEGLPNVLMEGMAAGCVPISTPVGAVPELLEQGKLGVLVPFGNSKALTDAILALARDPKRRAALAQRCRAKIEQDYNWDRLAQRYAAVIIAATNSSSIVEKKGR
jgi:glycosyltransferase involved in cell wall biosynthesis